MKILYRKEERFAKRWKDMTEEERKNADPDFEGDPDFWEANDIFMKHKQSLAGCDWIYMAEWEIKILDENGGNE